MMASEGETGESSTRAPKGPDGRPTQEGRSVCGGKEVTGVVEREAAR